MKLSEIIRQEQNRQWAAIPESRGYLDTFVTGLKAGAVNLPEVAGLAMKYIDRPGGLPWTEWGESLARQTRLYMLQHPELERSREVERLSEWHPKRMLRAGAEALPLTAAGITLGIPVSAAIGIAAPTAPLWVPTLAAAATVGGLFGLTAGGQTYDQVKAELTSHAAETGLELSDPAVQGHIEQQARKAGNMAALSEGLLEFVASIPVLSILRFGKAIPVKQIKDILRAGTWRGFMKNMATMFAAELSTEETQTILGNLILQKYGVKPDRTWHEGMGEALGATVLMTAFLQGTGSTLSARRKANLRKTLASPKTSPKQRLKAVRAVAADMRRIDRELADVWEAVATELVRARLPISTELEDFVEVFERKRKEAGPAEPEPIKTTGEASSETAREATEEPVPPAEPPPPEPPPVEPEPSEPPPVEPESPRPEREMFGEVPGEEITALFEPMTGMPGPEELQRFADQLDALHDEAYAQLGDVVLLAPEEILPFNRFKIAQEAEKLAAVPQLELPNPIVHGALQLLKTRQIELPGFTERGFTLKQETELRTLAQKEQLLRMRLKQLSVVPVKSAKIRQKIIDVQSELLETEYRKKILQLERLEALSTAIRRRLQALQQPVTPAPEEPGPTAAPVPEEVPPTAAPVPEEVPPTAAPVSEEVPPTAAPVPEEVPPTAAQPSSPEAPAPPATPVPEAIGAPIEIVPEVDIPASVRLSPAQFEELVDRMQEAGLLGTREPTIDLDDIDLPDAEELFGPPEVAPEEEPNVMTMARVLKSKLFDTAMLPEKPYTAADIERTIAEDRGITVDQLKQDETYSSRRIQEAAELAVVLKAKEIAADKSKSAEQKFEQINELYVHQPVMKRHTGESMRLRAHSTPINLAYIVSRIADVTPDKTVLEPTAGNGALLIEANPSNVVAVELDADRAASLRAQGFVTHEGDFLQIAPDIENKSFDVVLANPPFAAKESRFGRYRFGRLEHQIAAEALDKMKDDGRAVIIIGGKHFNERGLPTKTDWPFLSFIYSHYNVRANIELPGDVYRRQGATFPIRLIVIEGRKDKPSGVPPKGPDEAQYANSTEEIFQILKGGVARETTRPQVLGAAIPGQRGRPSAYGRLRPKDRPAVELADIHLRPGREAGLPMGRLGRAATERQRVDITPGGPFAPTGHPVLFGPRRIRPGVSVRREVLRGLGRGRHPSLAAVNGYERQRRRGAPKAYRFVGLARAGEREGGRRGAEELELGPVRKLPESVQGLEELSLASVGTELETAEPPRPDRARALAAGILKPKARQPRSIELLSVEEAMQQDVYEKLKPGLTAAWSKIQSRGGSYNDFVNTLIKKYGGKILPYLKQWQADQFSQEAAKDSAYQTAYKGLSANRDPFVAAPQYLVPFMQKAFDTYQQRHQGKSIDEVVKEELDYQDISDLFSALSGPQVDAIGLAIDAADSNKAIIVGDMTGVGKGRTAAAMIRYAIKNGLLPIFFTEKDYLLSDMIGRDLPAVNCDGKYKVKPFIVNGGVTVTDDAGNTIFKSLTGQERVDALRSDDIGDANAVFLTYSQIRSERVSPLPIRFMDRVIGRNRTLLILDEAHNATGKDSRTFRFMVQALSRAEAAMYLSATYSKRPDTLPVYFRTSLGLASSSIEDLAEAITRGGPVLQEFVAKHLASSGEYLRRELSYSDVRQDFFVDDKNLPRDKKQSDKVTELLRQIVAFDRNKLDFIEQINEQGGSTLIEALAHVSGLIKATSFASIVHQVIRQMQLALKVEFVAEQALKHLRNNKKVVCCLENTMETVVKTLLDANEIKLGDDPSRLTFDKVLLKCLSSTLSCRIIDEFGNRTVVKLPVESLPPALQREYRRIEQKIRKLTSALPVTPIDYIVQKIEAAGFKTEEISGRQYHVRPDEQGKPALQMRSTKEKLDKRGAMLRFNNGDSDFLLFTASGTAGWSGHADRNFKDQRQRVMLIAQPFLDINLVLQAMGRINRKGQVVPPEYYFLLSGIPSEVRPAAILKQKLAWLNANTTGSSEYVTKLNMPDILNKYGNRIIGQYVRENEEFRRTLDLPSLTVSRRTGQLVLPDDYARDVTGKVSLLPVAEQELFYDTVVPQYEALIEELNQRGENDLESKYYDFQAVPVGDPAVFVAGDNEANPFSASAVAQRMSCKVPARPRTADQIKGMVDQTLEGYPDEKAYRAGLVRDLEVKLKSFVVKRLEAERLTGDTRPITGLEVERTAIGYTIKYTWLNRNNRSQEGSINVYSRAELDALLGPSAMERLSREGTGRIADKEFLDGYELATGVRPIIYYNALNNIKQTIESPILGIGRMYDIRLWDGQIVKAVLVGFRWYRPAVQNPVQRHNIVAKFATNSNGLPIYELPMSRLDSELSKGNIMPVEGTQIIVNRPDWPEIWNSVRPSADRTEYTILTGNIISAFSHLPRGSRAINFSMNDGTIQAGILLPRQGGITVLLPNVALGSDRILRFLQDTPTGVVFNGDQTLEISKAGQSYDSNRFIISLNAGPSIFQRFYNTETVRQYLLDDWTSMDRRHWLASVHENRLVEFINALKTNTGDTFFVDRTAYGNWVSEARADERLAAAPRSKEQVPDKIFADAILNNVIIPALKEVLPKEAMAHVKARAVKRIKLTRSALKSLRDHGVTKDEALEVLRGRSKKYTVKAITRLLAKGNVFALIDIAYASPETIYHEGFHAAAVLCLPDDVLQKLYRYYGNEEMTARAFGDYVAKKKELRQFVHPNWVRRLWNRIAQFLKRLKRRLLKQQFRTPEEVFEAILNKEFATLSGAEIRARIQKRIKQTQHYKLAVDERDLIQKQIEDFDKYISWEGGRPPISIKEALKILYTHTVDKFYPIDAFAGLAEVSIKKGVTLYDHLKKQLAEQLTATQQLDKLKNFEQYFDQWLVQKFSDSELWYLNYIKENDAIPPGLDPRLLIGRYLGNTAVADTWLKSRRGAEDRVLYMDDEGNLVTLYDKTLETILTQADDYKDVIRYMVAQRDIELSGRLSAYDREILGVHPEESEALIEAMKTKYGKQFDTKIDKIALEIRQWAHATLLQPLLKAGLLKDETYKKIVASNLFYIPFMRVMHEIATEGYVPVRTNIFQPKGLPIKTIRGSFRQLVNPLESLVTMAYKTADILTRAKVAQAIAKLRLTTPEMQAEIVPVPAKRFPFKQTLTEQYDPVLYEQIVKLANKLGADIQTLRKIGRNKLGRFRREVGKKPMIERMFATTEQVLSHEFGHFLDDQFGLRSLLIRNKALREELKRIALQRIEPFEPVSPSMRREVLKGSELVAEFVARFITNRAVAEKLAPNVCNIFKEFCEFTKELNPILEWKPSEAYSTMDYDATFWVPSPFNPAPDTIMAFEDGKRRYYKVPNDVWRASMSMNSQEANLMIQVLGAPARWLRAGATLTLGFITRNPLRDMVGAWIYGHKYGFKLRHYVQGFAEVLKQGKRFRDWEAAGGPFSMLVSLDRAKTKLTVDELTGKSNKLVKYAKNPLEALRMLSEFSEKTTRVAVYIAALEQGYTEVEAMAMSRDATLDFAKIGESTRILNQLMAFWNANIRAMDKLVREVVTGEDRVHTLQRIFMGITLPSLALWFINHDDERYKELPSWQKNLFWIIICGKDGPIIRLPKPFELGIIFGSLFERFMEYVFEKDSRALKSAWSAIQQGAAPGCIPTVAVPFIEAFQGKSFFLDRPLEDEATRRLPLEMRYKPWTTETAKVVGKLIHMSPIMVENWVRKWTGGLGIGTLRGIDSVLRAMGVEVPEKLPEAKWYRRITPFSAFTAREPIGPGSESISRFYDNLRTIQETGRGLRHLADQRNLAEYREYRQKHRPEIVMLKSANRLSRRLTELRKRAEVIRASRRLSAENKRARLQTIYRRMTTLAARFNKRYEQYKRSGVKKPTALVAVGIR